MSTFTSFTTAYFIRAITRFPFVLLSSVFIVYIWTTMMAGMPPVIAFIIIRATALPIRTVLTVWTSITLWNSTLPISVISKATWLSFARDGVSPVWHFFINLIPSIRVYRFLWTGSWQICNYGCKTLDFSSILRWLSHWISTASIIMVGWVVINKAFFVVPRALMFCHTIL